MFGTEKKKCLLLLFMLPAFESIRVNIIGKDKKSSEVRYEGDSHELISDSEEIEFNLYGDPLIDMVNKHSGHKNDKCYTKPKSEADRHIFENSPRKGKPPVYKIRPVVRDLTIEDANIKIINNELVTVLNRTYVNNNKTDMSTEQYIRKNLEIKITSSWEDPKPLLNYKIDYNFELGYEEFTIDPEWGAEINVTKPYEVLETLNQVVKPGKKLEVQLKVHKITAEVEIHFDGEIGGNIVCYSKQEYDYDHYHKFSAETILEENNLPWTNNAVHKIQMVYYFQPKVTIVSN